MGMQQFCWRSLFCLHFVNEIYLSYRCVVFAVVFQLLRRFRRVIVRWVSTAKRKTRLHIDFWSARRSKRINPLKIALPTQFLRKNKEEMLKLPLHNSVHNTFATIHLFRDCFARNRQPVSNGFANTQTKMLPGYPRI